MDAGSDASPDGPVVLVADAGTGVLATDATYVYWLDPTNGRISRCPIAGCPSGPTVFFQQAGYDQGSGWGIGGIAVTSDTVYFALNQTVSGELLQCPTSGCGSPLAFVKTNGGIYGVTADANHVYYAYDGGLWSMPLGSGGPTLLVTSGVSAHVGAIAAVNGPVYFATDTPAGPIGECAENGCQGMPGSLPSTGPPLLAVTLAANSLAAYWTSEASGAILSSLVPSGPASVFASVTAPAQTLVADDHDVYFGSAQAGGAIYSCPATECGSAQKLVAGNLGNVEALAIDAYRIYAIVFPGQMRELIEIDR